MTERQDAASSDRATPPTGDPVAEVIRPVVEDAPTVSEVSAGHGVPGRPPVRLPARRPWPTGSGPLRPVQAPISALAGLRRRQVDADELRQRLDASGAEAEDLRAYLHQLRQDIDETQAGMPPAFPTERTAFATGRPARRWPWILAALGIMACLLWLASRCSGPSTATPSPSATGPSAVATAPSVNPATKAATASAGTPAGRSATPAASASVAPAATPSQAVVAAPGTLRWPGGAVAAPPSLPAEGPGLTTPGTHAETAVDDDGRSVDAYERVLLAQPGSGPLTLTAPDPGTLPDGLAPKVTDVQIDLDGVPATVTSDGTTWTATPASGASYTSAVVRYRLTGAVAAQRPAQKGRESAVAVPFTAALSQKAGQPVVVRMVSPGAVQVSCPGAALTDLLCGTVDGGIASATVPASATAHPAVLVTVNRG